jgi:D-alanyl-D-alanine endopeptidase (penicillin-binding protein 7)
MSGSLTPALALFVALGVSLTPVDSVNAAPKSNADSGSVSRAKPAGKKKQAATRRAGVPAAKTKKTPAVSPADAHSHGKPPVVKSGAALVVEQTGGGALFQKNAGAVVPIASISKLMTAMVVLDAWPDLRAPIAITEDDVDYLRGSHSRLQLGATMTRETALLLTLMSSENRAAHALARHYPGGLSAFVAAMNGKARALGMRDTRFEDPTGLSSNNVSTARDLARLVAAAHRYPLIREFSTKVGATVEIAGRPLEFRNTNPLVGNASWNVGLSKTGYIQEAGKCLVMQARVADRPVVIVLLDSAGKLTRVSDANRIRRWMEARLAAHGMRAQRTSSDATDAAPG